MGPASASSTGSRWGAGSPAPVHFAKVDIPQEAFIAALEIEE
jgi:hypothetical protein